MMRALFIGMAALSVSACATTSVQPVQTAGLLGAWSSGDTAESCATDQITYFSSDGVVIDMYSKDGAFHSFGKWGVIGDQLIITHNEYPLPATGVSEPDIILTVIEVTDTEFRRQNAKGEIRTYVKCEGLTLNVGRGEKSY